MYSILDGLTGVLARELFPHVKSIVGVDISQGMVYLFPTSENQNDLTNCISSTSSNCMRTNRASTPKKCALFAQTFPPSPMR